ncbi:hypothetical protein [uncultured Sphingomonas sp.]|uniref:hypothetical protein n=1 Tax=uncultured Sphingomonas sp. TaxID=158754 RepID=UPI0025E32990|nr:hypothetical protein [uncultured Sphingomonas sp.]
MQRRRLALGLSVLAFAILIAVKPPIGQLRLSLDTDPETGPARAEAAIEIGTIAVSILFRQAERRVR